MAIVEVGESNCDKFLDYGIHKISFKEYNVLKPDYAFFIEDYGKLCGRAGVWWKNTPNYKEKKTGYIGYIESVDKSYFEEIISHAEAILMEHNCTIAIGPIDGSTWKTYRAKSEKIDDEPDFAGEPYYCGKVVELLKTREYEVISKYYSYSSKDVLKKDTRYERFVKTSTFKEFSTRGFDKNRFESEIELMYNISIEAFKDNFLYTPISKEDFVKMYSGYADFIDSRFVKFVLYKEKECGFVFGYQDKEPKRIVVKTIAVLPKCRGIGAASILLEELNETAFKNGYEKVIHALMYSGNASLKLSKRYGTPIAEYLLFGKEL